MSLIEYICVFILGGCVGAIIVNFIWYRHCNKISSEWKNHCNELNENWSKRCNEMNDSWRNFYDDLIEGLAKAEEEGGSDENNIT